MRIVRAGTARILGFRDAEEDQALESRILEATRGLDWEAYDRSVDVLVSRLRGKLGDDARRPRLIRTVRGTGYSFIGGGGEGD